MNNKNPNKSLLYFNLVLGILIIVSPIIITGHFLYDIQTLIGDIRVAEFVMRTAAFIIGLVIINEGIKNYFKQ